VDWRSQIHGALLEGAWLRRRRPCSTTSR